MDTQNDVAAFLERHDLETDPAYRALDLSSEVGEVAKELTESTAYGADPDAAAIARDELGDALFALLALCTEVDVDAGAALEESLEKYERRLETSGSAGSGS
ncbi:MazG-like family protein [Natronosalvus rutilus]|uniref:MazG-like family protein n=1 Tax=Natronosalvus rutilus TaxID=2953753 RepID=A0A9E7NDS2_9EURY|nr:MazG-like family protein [Natronosalvus rutilus]UTF55038.1 MazG-like family protein [Natronosalvus rutilus]